MRLCVTSGNNTEVFQWNTMFLFSPPASRSALITHESTGSTQFTHNKKVNSILQAIASDVYKTSIWKHTKIKLHRYIIYMQWRAQKVNKDKILMQKTRTPRNDKCN